MRILHERCCGIDVHKKSVTACRLTPEGKEIQSFGTMTEDVIALVDWIKEGECTHVAMESTGVLWKPIYNLLELEDIETLVVNAQHIKAVPGRKTDVKDAEWIADLLKHGLLQGSYIPNREQRELRELIRYRRSLIEERSREKNRVQKILEGANIKLSSVASDVFGKSGRAMLEALIKGVEDPKILAQLAQKRMKNKINELERALNGLIGTHQKMILKMQLEHIDDLTNRINLLDKEVKERMRPFEEDLDLLDTIPGVSIKTAQAIIAEIGVNMDQFPSAAHLCSWAGLAPGNNESAGKKKSSKTRKGNKKLRATLTEAAWGAMKVKECYLSSQYHRIAARRGSKRAIIAVAHSILTIAYYILKRRQPYKELGNDYLEVRKKEIITKQAVKRLEKLGYKVDIQEIA